MKALIERLLAQHKMTTGPDFAIGAKVKTCNWNSNRKRVDLGRYICEIPLMVDPTPVGEAIIDALKLERNREWKPRKEWRALILAERTGTLRPVSYAGLEATTRQVDSIAAIVERFRVRSSEWGTWSSAQSLGKR